MIKKKTKSDNYNVAYFPTVIDYTLTITKSLQSDYHQERDEKIEIIDCVSQTNQGKENI